jgi:Sulfotransferase domain
MRNPITRLIRRYRFGEPIVIVSGLPRSGTSMVMKMLDAGGFPILTDQVRRADEDNPEGYFEYEPVKQLASQRDKSWVRAARGKALKVISHLVKELPPDNFYSVILVRRDLTEVLKSQNIMLKRRQQPNPIEDAQAEELYRKHLLNVQLHLQNSPNTEVLSLRFHEIVHDPLTSARQISRFVPGRLDPNRMAGVVNERLYRNRNPQPAT